MMEELINTLIGGLIAIGTLGVAYLFDVCKEKYKFKYKANTEFNITVFDIYKRATDEITEALLPMVHLGLVHRHISKEEMIQWQKIISNLYYKFNAYLPQDVLNEMSCLYKCLDTQGKQLYCIRDFNIVEVCTQDTAIEKFQDTALVGKKEYVYGDKHKKHNLTKLSSCHIINIQARSVIKSVGEILANKELKDWGQILKKTTVLQKQKRSDF